jgi:hypothetical protein
MDGGRRRSCVRCGFEFSDLELLNHSQGQFAQLRARIESPNGKLLRKRNS